jgi:hypothetical protein
MIRTIAIFVTLCSTSFVQAETVSLTATAAKAECTRASLQAAVDRYLDALKKGSPSDMPLASQAKYTENAKEIAIGQGIWRTALDVDFHRSLLDVDACETFTEVIHTNRRNPYVLGTRLKVIEGKISEIVTIATTNGDWLFNADNYLKYSQKEDWNVIPAAQRSDRQTLIHAASAYFDVFSDGSSKVPWGIPCARLEGGIYTAKTFDDPNASCNVGISPDPKVHLTNRHYVVDPDIGAVVGFVSFGGEKGSVPDSHLFRVQNGKLRYIHTLTVCTIPNCGFPVNPKLKPPQ